MPSLALDQENTRHILALFAVGDNGMLYAPESVEFVVLDASGEQIFPSSGREDVTTESVALGVYPALDIAMGTGLTPSEADDWEVGKHTIVWYFTDSDGEEELEWRQTFYVVDAALAIPYWTYISAQEVRDEGLTSSLASDAWLVDILQRTQEYIDTQTRQMFRPVPESLRVDGSNGEMLHLHIPIVGIEYLKVNRSTQELDPESYEVYATPALEAYSHAFGQDYRRNPKIAMSADASIFSGGRVGRAGEFAEGRRNQTIKGVFGFLEANGATPELIRRAHLRLVMANAERLTVGASSSTPAGPIASETSDRHSISYATTSTTSTSALATTQEVEEILAMYRAPIGISVVG